MTNLTSPNRPHPHELHHAIEANDIEKAIILIKEGKRGLTIRNNTGYPPIHLAVRSGSKDLVEFLLKAGVDVNQKDIEDSTPMHHACCWNVDVNIAKFLLFNGADVCAIDKYGYTPLHRAMWHRSNREIQEEVVQLLIYHGAPTDIRALNGLTPSDLGELNGDKDPEGRDDITNQDPKMQKLFQLLKEHGS